MKGTLSFTMKVTRHHCESKVNVPLVFPVAWPGAAHDSGLP